MRLLWVILCFFWIIFGVVAGDFWLHVATKFLIMMLFAMSFSLLYGHTGLLSFGQAAFFGVGAYGFALSVTKLGLPFLPCLIIGLVSSVLWAWITGHICVRLSGIYFAIMTVVVTQMTFYILFQWYGFTGGDDGIQGLLPPSFLRDPHAYYYYTLMIAAIAYFAYYKILSSPFGLSLRCIRENMVRIEFVGVNVRRHRLRAFILAGFFAGLAGVLFAPFSRTIAPQMANWHSSGNAVFMGILGGAPYLLGPSVGAGVWVFLDAFVSGYTVYWPLIIGLIIFFIVFFMPGGLTGLVSTYLTSGKERPTIVPGV